MKKVSATTTKLVDLENRLKRALADYQNLEKRHSSQRLDLVKYANAALLDKLLPLLDDLERAQQHLNDSGLKLIIDRFHQTLSSQGVTPINSHNTPFNPETMDCLEVIPGVKDVVISTHTQGFFYHDKVLRPARVTVGSGEKTK